MKYQISQEKLILEVIERNDDGEGFGTDFPEFLSQFGFESRDKEEVAAMWENFCYQIRQIEQRGFIKVSPIGDTAISLELLPLGHEQLEFHRKNTWYFKVVSVLCRWMDKAMTSVVFPIVAAVLTVFVMQFFGLAN